MNDSTKVWVYQSSREFTDEEIDELSISLKNFVSGWQAHGAALSANFELLERRFIVFFVNEHAAAASGCSIDSSVGVIRSVEKKYNVNMTDKGQVAFRHEDKIKVIPLSKIKTTIESGDISKKTIIFNNSVATLKEFKHNWQIEAEASWMKRYFN